MHVNRYMDLSEQAAVKMGYFFTCSFGYKITDMRHCLIY